MDDEQAGVVTALVARLRSCPSVDFALLNEAADKIESLCYVRQEEEVMRPLGKIIDPGGEAWFAEGLKAGQLEATAEVESLRSTVAALHARLDAAEAIVHYYDDPDCEDDGALMLYHQWAALAAALPISPKT